MAAIQSMIKPMTSLPDRYAVFGKPISHSKSPRIHSLFAQQTNQNIVYTAQEVAPEHFVEQAKAFYAEGGRGLNCTIPLKEMAFAFANQHTERAKRAKAVNTLIAQDDGSILGDNTDGIGLVNDLTKNLGIDLCNKRLLVIGAGGATRGILAPLLACEPQSLHLVNRTHSKALLLQHEFESLGAILACEYAALSNMEFDLIINASAASLDNQLPPLPQQIVSSATCCYDLAYANQATAFVQWGLSEGAKISVDGLGMLVEQAAEAFRLWRKISPDTKQVIDLLNKERG